MDGITCPCHNLTQTMLLKMGSRLPDNTGTMFNTSLPLDNAGDIIRPVALIHFREVSSDAIQTPILLSIAVSCLRSLCPLVDKYLGN